MSGITYEQFMNWCKHWNYTTEEGFRAMCFVANIVNQNFSNYSDYCAVVENNEQRSEAFKKLVTGQKDSALILSTLYNQLENNVYLMLEQHDSEEEV